MLGWMSDHAQRSRRGSGDGMYANGERMQHGKPDSTEEGTPQPEAREGQEGLDWVAERLVVPGKPGNAGGGKRPQFKGMSKEARARRLV